MSKIITTTTTELTKVNEGRRAWQKYKRGYKTAGQQENTNLGSDFHNHILEDVYCNNANRSKVLDMEMSLGKYEKYLNLLNPRNKLPHDALTKEPDATAHEIGIKLIFKDKDGIEYHVKMKIDQVRVNMNLKFVILNDFKTISNVSDEAIFNAFKSSSIVLQVASYSEGFKFAFPQCKDFKFYHLVTFVSKEEIPECRMWRLSDKDIITGKRSFYSSLRRLDKIQEEELDGNEYNGLMPTAIDLPNHVFKKDFKTIKLHENE